MDRGWIGKATITRPTGILLDLHPNARDKKSLQAEVTYSYGDRLDNYRRASLEVRTDPRNIVAQGRLIRRRRISVLLLLLLLRAPWRHTAPSR
jgi:hypothetical protein